MSTRNDVEQELRRTLTEAAQRVRIENRWDDLVDRIDSGDEYTAPVVVSLRSAKRRWSPVVVVAAAFFAVVVVVGLTGLIGGAGSETDSQLAAETPQPSEPTLAEPAPVWPPAIPNVEGQAEAAWHCPDFEAQPEERLDPTQVPDELRYLPAGDAPVREAWGFNHGPGCARSPALVAVTFANEQQTGVSAAVVVWVEQPTGHQLFDDPSSTAQGSASRADETISSVDGFILRHSIDGRGVDEVEAVGVIDELPVWIESSGIIPDRLIELTAAMSASSETGRVQLTDTSNEFVVVRSNSVEAKVIDHITWYVEGPGIGQSLEITTIPEKNTYQIPVGFYPGLQLTDVAGTVGVLGGEEGGTQQLTWEIKPGLQAWVSGDYGTDLATVAESLDLVGRDDPRLPAD